MTRTLSGLFLLVTLVSVPAATAQPVGPPSASPDEEPTAQAGLAAAPSVTVELEPAAVTVGDRVEALLTLDAGRTPAGPPRFPVWEEHWGAAEILLVEPPSDQGQGIWRQRLQLALFETGPATLPGVEVELPAAEATTTVRSDPVTIQVDSVLPATEEEVAPQPPAPVRTLPVGQPFWWAMALLGIPCLILGFLALRTARRVSAALAAMALSPIEAFQGALARLRAETGVERVYTGLSLELRRYLGRALGFPAAEGTTTEIQRSLRERQLPPDLVRETLGLLREADQIKFARGESDRQRVGQRLDDAERLAGSVETWLEPVLDEGSGEEREAVA